MSGKSMRVIKLRVGDIDGDPKEIMKRWHQLRFDVQYAKNSMFQWWIVWHTVNQSADKIRKFLDRYAKWKVGEKGKRGDKPKLDFDCWPKQLAPVIGKTMNSAAPGINARTKTLVINTEQKSFQTKKASRGMLRSWTAVLLCHESMPSFTNPQPIPFDRANSGLYRDGKDWKFFMRLDKLESTTKNGKPKSDSHRDVFTVHTRRFDKSSRAILGGIDDGTIKFCGSALTFNARDRCWYVLLSYQREKRTVVGLDPTKTAFLKPGMKSPWLFRRDGRRTRIAATGDDVAYVRRCVMSQRAGRKHNYRFSTSHRKGHGDKRANMPLWKLTQRWNEFTKRHNHESARRAVEWCVESGIGTLVYLKPSEKRCRSARLATAGKSERQRESSSWDWFQFARYLQEKCDDRGVTLVINKPFAVAETEEGELREAVTAGVV